MAVVVVVLLGGGRFFVVNSGQYMNKRVEVIPPLDLASSTQVE